MNTEKDFWKNVDRKSNDKCWPWKGCINRWGYGRYRFNGSLHMAHRLALKFLRPDLELKNKVVMHVCDNPSCCNPNHLLLGTHADNQSDKYKKNRQAKGEKNGQSFLTEQQVIEMRKKYIPRKMTYEMLAKEYKVCKDTVQKAVRGIYWKYL